MATLRSCALLALACSIPGAARGLPAGGKGPAALSGTAFQPRHGRTGTTVLVSGAGLDRVAGVDVGGVAAPDFSVAPDGAALTFRVPAGAGSGPVLLKTPAGAFPVQGGPFRLDGEVPSITDFQPKRGGPGTEVTVTGTALGGVDHVQFGGQELDRSRFDVDSPTRVRVRVPDDARSDAVLALAAGDGSAQTPEAFVIVPTPSLALRLPLVPSGPPGPDGETWLDFPVTDRSDLYGRLMPKAPIFLPLNPDGRNGDGTYGLREARSELSIVYYARYTLSLRLPPSFLPSLPPALLARLKGLKVAPEKVDILCESQDYLYDGSSGPGGTYLFRPHPWTDPDAPMYGSYACGHNLGAALFETDPGMTLGSHGEGEWFEYAILTQGSGEAEGGQVLALGGELPLAGLDVEASTGFWSLVLDRDTGRAAATLHLFFSDRDQSILDGLTPSWHELDDLVRGLGENLGATKGVRLLLRLFRPRVDAVALSLPDASGRVRAALTGCGLSGAMAVLVDGVPVLPFRVVSDAQVRVLLPAGAAGSLQVATPLGTSDPVELAPTARARAPGSRGSATGR